MNKKKEKKTFELILKIKTTKIPKILIICFGANQKTQLILKKKILLLLQ